MIKKITVAFSAALLLLTSMAEAQKNEKLEFVKEKSISKTYPAGGNTLSITNSFGHVKFIAWDKNEIKVDVRIEVSSSDKDNAERTFEGITVSDNQSGDKIRFKTNHAQSNNNSCHNCRTNMQVNYEVHLPSTVALEVNNSFGNTELPDYKGAVDITNKFGNLIAGSLTNVKDLHVEFGKVQIKSVSNINVTFKFSKIQIENLSGANKITMDFCDSSKIVLPDNLVSLDLKESYSTINLKPSAGLAASYYIRTSFGNFIDRTSVGVTRTDQRERYGADSERTYEGKSGAGTAKVNIRSSFGKLILGEATAEDMKKTTQAKKSKYAGKVI